jgi:hypothetical protein
MNWISFMAHVLGWYLVVGAVLACVALLTWDHIQVIRAHKSETGKLETVLVLTFLWGPLAIAAILHKNGD